MLYPSSEVTSCQHRYARTAWSGTWHAAMLTALVLSASCNAASAISTHCVAASMLSRSRAAAYRADPLSPYKPA